MSLSFHHSILCFNAAKAHTPILDYSKCVNLPQFTIKNLLYIWYILKMSTVFY